MNSGTVKIISGTLRGKKIPFLNSKYGDADITSQKVKGALFSMLGERLYGKVFVDLFSGSGQIGFEAISRGAQEVIFNEADRSRFSFIKEFASSLHADIKPLFLNMKAADALRYVSGKGIKADIIFIDPPYEKIKGEAESYGSIINVIEECGIMAAGGVVIIQHFSKNVLHESYGSFSLVSCKKYGTTTLSVYSSD